MMRTRAKIRVATALACLHLALTSAPAAPAAPSAPPPPLSSPASSAPGDDAGWARTPSGVRYREIGVYDKARFAEIMGPAFDAYAKVTPVPSAVYRKGFGDARFAVRLYQVLYRSAVPEQGDRSTMVSGLVAVPQTGEAVLPMLSYQHGLTFDATWVPSFIEKHYETQLVLARYASQGYVVVASDFIGRGLSTEPDTVLVRESNAHACTDMIAAGRDVMAVEGKKPGGLLLCGFSYGGWVTLVLLRHLEEVGIPVTAAVTAGAPLDLTLILNRWVGNPQSGDAPWLVEVLALHLNALERYRGLSGLTAEAIRPAYVDLARDFYTGKITWAKFGKRAPERCDVFTPPALLRSTSDVARAYRRIIDEANAYRWRSHTPLITYYGGADEVVPASTARLAAQFHAIMGCGPTEARYAGARADHRATFLHALVDSKPWFDGFLSSQ